MENDKKNNITGSPKTVTIYGIYTIDDELHGSIKAYCSTEDIAKRELNNYCDWFCDKPPKPDDRHIKRFEMLIE